MDIQRELLDTVLRADQAGANALLDAWAAEHGYGRLLMDVVEPMLEYVGRSYMDSQTVTLAQAYVAGMIAEDALNKMVAQNRRGQSENLLPRRPVVIGNIEEDFHALGRKMVGTFLTAEGWQVHDLGNDVSAQLFVDKAQEVGARVIGVSAMMTTTAHNIRQLRAEIDRRGLTGRIQLAVGGAIFVLCPEMVQEVGGDGTAPNALGAARLFEQLWQRSLDAKAGA
jgi:methanogenic corrinoid protein MtbC1